jgi:adenylosuccinate lyase
MLKRLWLGLMLRLATYPQKDGEKIATVSSVKHIKLSRMKEIERETKHDDVA